MQRAGCRPPVWRQQHHPLSSLRLHANFDAGAGTVGETLGQRLAKAGAHVRYGRRRAATKEEEIPSIVAWAQAVVLATPGMRDDQDIVQLAHSLGPGAAGKILLDATNPFGPDLTTRCWEARSSAAEVLQQALPATDVYKVRQGG